MGLRELRYTNLQIALNFRDVCEDIYRHIESVIEEDSIFDTKMSDKGIEGE